MITECSGLLDYFVCVSAGNMLEYFISVFSVRGDFFCFVSLKEDGVLPIRD